MRSPAPRSVVDPTSVLSSLDNAIARKRLLRVVLQEAHIPQATYDFVKSSHRVVDDMLHVMFHFFLPVTRRVRRQSAIIGSDFALIVNLWAVPKVITDRLIVVDNRTHDDGTDHEVHVLAPIREDQAGIVW